jgi:hypothetical protein
MADGVRAVRLAHDRDLIGFEHSGRLGHYRITDHGEGIVLGIVDRLFAGDIDRASMLGDYFRWESGLRRRAESAARAEKKRCASECDRN